MPADKTDAGEQGKITDTIRDKVWEIVDPIVAFAIES